MKGEGRMGRLGMGSSQELRGLLVKLLLDLERAGVERRQAFLLLWRLLLIRRDAYRDQPLGLAEVWKRLEGLTTEVGKGIGVEIATLESLGSEGRELLGDSPFFLWSAFTDEVLRRLILELSFGLQGVEDEVMGEVLVSLIERFWLKEAELSQGWLPECLVSLMVSLLGPLSGGTVYEPMAAMGQLLVALVRGSEGLNGCLGLLPSPEWAILTRLFLGLQGLNGVEYLLPNQLPQEPLAAVVGVLPLLQEDWRRATEMLGGRTEELVALGELVSHYLTLLRPGGRAVLVVPPGVLFRERDTQFRRQWIEEGLVVAVMMLPSKFFFHTPMAAALLVFERPVFSSPRRKVWFGDAGEVELSVEGNSCQTLLKLFEQGETKEGVATWVSVEEIGEANYTLSVSRYLSRGTSTTDWQEAWQSEWQRFRGFEQEREEALGEMEVCFERLGLFLPMPDEGRD